MRACVNWRPLERRCRSRFECPRAVEGYRADIDQGHLAGALVGPVDGAGALIEIAIWQCSLAVMRTPCAAAILSPNPSTSAGVRQRWKVRGGSAAALLEVSLTFHRPGINVGPRAQALDAEIKAAATTSANRKCFAMRDSVDLVPARGAPARGEWHERLFPRRGRLNRRTAKF